MASVARLFIRNNITNCVTDGPTQGQIFIIPARELSITWGDDTRYWQWRFLEEDRTVEVAELIEVCWLEVKGTTQMENLDAGVKYRVMFVMKMKNPSGMEPEATFKLQVPGKTMDRKLSLQAIGADKWVGVEVGQFRATKEGEINFSMANYEDPNWKKGLILAGVAIVPIF